MESIYQTHSGSGDNVNEKFVINEFYNDYSQIINTTFPDDLKDNVRSIARDINDRKLPTARREIEILMKVGSLNNDSKALLRLLNMRIDILENPEISLSKTDLKSIQDITHNTILGDLALAMLMREDHKKGGPEAAKARMQTAASKGEYSQSFIYDFLTDKTELLAIAEDKPTLYALNENTLWGLIQGLLKNDLSEQAFNVACFMHDEFESNNSKVILLICKAIMLNATFIETDYWLLPQAKKNLIADIISETITLYRDSEYPDRRLLNIAVPLFINTKEQSPELHDICLVNIDVVEKFKASLATRLNEEKIRKALLDSFSDEERHEYFKKENIKLYESLVRKEEINIQDIILVSKIMQAADFQNWLRTRSIVVNSEDALDNELTELVYSLHLDNNNYEIDEKLNVIMERNDLNIKEINSLFLLNLMALLQEKGKSFEACQLFSKLIHLEKNTWCSPLVEQYFFSLNEAKQYQQLHKSYEIIDDQDKTIEVHCMAAGCLLIHSQAEKADQILSGLRIEQDIRLIVLKINVLRVLKKDEKIKKFIHDLDDKILLTPCHQLSVLFLTLSELGYYKVIERAIVKIFVNDPEKNARFVSDACLRITMVKNKSEFIPSNSIDNIMGGFVYNANGKEFVKIILSNNKIQSSCILDKSSPIGEKLLNVRVGETIVHGLTHLTLQEKLPPYVAVFRLSGKLREECNEGLDHFASHTLSSEPEEMVRQISSLLTRTGANNNPIEERGINNENLPLDLRASLLGANHLVKSTLEVLVSKEAKKGGLVHNGNMLDAAVFTDISTICYLSLTSLTRYFIEKKITFHMTDEHVNAVDDWLTSIEQNTYNYLTLDSNGNPLLHQGHDILKYHPSLYQNLKEIRSCIQGYSLSMQDYSKEMLLLGEIGNGSFAKFLYALKGSDLNYFSVDTKSCEYAFLFFQKNRVNTFGILQEAVKETPYSEREEGVIYHALGCFPYPVLPNDFYKLAASMKDPHGVYLSSLINNYSGNFNPDINVFNFMSQIFINYVVYPKTHLGLLNIHTQSWGEELFDSNPYSACFDRVFYACSQAVTARHGSTVSSRESKLAKFIYALLIKSNLNLELGYLIQHLTAKYLQGHFLDLNVIDEFLANLQPGNKQP